MLGAPGITMEIYTEVVSSATRDALRKPGDQPGRYTPLLRFAAVPAYEKGRFYDRNGPLTCGEVFIPEGAGWCQEGSRLRFYGRFYLAGHGGMTSRLLSLTTIRARRRPSRRRPGL